MTDKAKITIQLALFRGIKYTSALTIISLVLSIFNPLFIVPFLFLGLLTYDVVGYTFSNARKTFDNIEEWSPEPPILANQAYRYDNFWTSFILCIIPVNLGVIGYYGWVDALFIDLTFFILFITGTKEMAYYLTLYIRLKNDEIMPWCNYTFFGKFIKGDITAKDMKVQTIFGVSLAILIAFIWQYKLWRLV